MFFLESLELCLLNVVLEPLRFIKELDVALELQAGGLPHPMLHPDGGHFEVEGAGLMNSHLRSGLLLTPSLFQEMEQYFGATLLTAFFQPHL